MVISSLRGLRREAFLPARSLQQELLRGHLRKGKQPAADDQAQAGPSHPVLRQQPDGTPRQKEKLPEPQDARCIPFLGNGHSWTHGKDEAAP